MTMSVILLTLTVLAIAMMAYRIASAQMARAFGWWLTACLVFLGWLVVR